jgi:hypothetical protein
MYPLDRLWKVIPAAVSGFLALRSDLGSNSGIWLGLDAVAVEVKFEEVGSPVG